MKQPNHSEDYAKCVSAKNAKKQKTTVSTSTRKYVRCTKESDNAKSKSAGKGTRTVKKKKESKD